MKVPTILATIAPLGVLEVLAVLLRVRNSTTQLIKTKKWLGIAAPQKKKTVDDFEFGDVLGEGSYGEVKLVTEKETGATYAAKILAKKHIVKENKIKYVNSEKALLDILHHPNIVQLYCTFQDKENLCILVEIIMLLIFDDIEISL